MSALSPKADITKRDRHVRFVPEADIFVSGCRGRIKPKINSILWFSGTSKQSVVLKSQAFFDATDYIPAQVSGDICGSRTAMSMRYQNSNQFVPRPLCPSCAQIIRLARITSRFDDLPDLYIFECRACGVSHIESALVGIKIAA
jgi:hypothetical protein